MNKKMSKRQRDIKTKLMAAICMLLVSSIMMVSTTYAWFTLSTAPEVTGINTAVGANGNLEMALMPTDALTKGVANDYGITSSAGDSTAEQLKRNVTWGNLVDLGLEGETDNYGLTKITLYPSKLNAAVEDAQKNPTTLGEAMLLTPAYGADGRVSELKEDTLTSLYDTTEGNFPQTEGLGVRAVGTASGMTDRQLAYRNARSAANTSMSQAKTAAAQSLNANGSALANIALAHGIDADATHTKADVDALKAIVSDLLGTADKTGALQHIENAYRSYIIAFAASKAAATAGLTDEQFAVYQSNVNAAENVYAAAQVGGVTLPDYVTIPLAKLQATRASVLDAQSKLNALTAESGITWAELSPALYLLADTEGMLINGYAASTVKQNMNAIVNSVMSGGLTVTMETSGGVYADIADHCGDYNASVKIKKVEYSGMTLEDVTARMETKTKIPTMKWSEVDASASLGATAVGDVFLGAISGFVNTAGAPVSEGGQTLPITDMFGYVIDLAFRTNASDSNLLLQTEAKDRIYGGDGTEEVMGGGSTMTFTSTTTGFSNEQVKELMKAIRIVFFNPTNKAVMATAKLDAQNAEITAEGITAEMYLYKLEAGGIDRYEPVTYAADNGITEYYSATEAYDEIDDATASKTTEQLYIKNADNSYSKATYEAAAEGTTPTQYYTLSYTYSLVNDPATANVQLYKKTTTTEGENKLEGNNAVITALTQNTATAVSVLVYLDGENVGNDDVAATVATSMTGTMNLQFSSSADLVPMNYTPLIRQEAATEPSGAAEVTP